MSAPEQFSNLSAHERLQMLGPRITDVERRIYQLNLDRVTQNLTSEQPELTEQQRALEWLKAEQHKLEEEISERKQAIQE